MHSVVFLTQFWPTYGIVHFTPEGLISSWYTYEIKIHVRIKYLLLQVWNKIIAYLPTYQIEKVGHWAKTVYMYITKNQKNPQRWGLGLLRLREGFS